MKKILGKLNLYKSVTLNSDLNKDELIVKLKKLFDELTKSDRKYVGYLKRNNL